jgi:hypothetical protein
MCNFLIGYKLAQFPTNVNSWNFDINFYNAFLEILLHFVLEKFDSLQPVIASLCVNVVIFYAVCDGFKFNLNNYFNHLSHLIYGFDCLQCGDC